MDADESLRLSAEQNGNENGSMSSNEDDMNQEDDDMLEEPSASTAAEAPEPPNEVLDREKKDSSTIPKQRDLFKEIDELRRNQTSIAHSLQLIMSALHVPRCGCPTCAASLSRVKQPAPAFPSHRLLLAPPHVRPPPAAMPPHLLSFPSGMSQSHAASPFFPPSIAQAQLPAASAAVPPQETQNAPKTQPLTTPASPAKAAAPASLTDDEVTIIEKSTVDEAENVSAEPECTKDSCASEDGQSESEMAANALLSQLFPGAALISNLAAAAGAVNPFAAISEIRTPTLPPPSKGGRKSKYCTPEEKKLVAEYARVHGPANAARKFGIPPSVAAYYQRKESKQMHHQNHGDFNVSASAPLLLHPVKSEQPAASTNSSQPKATAPETSDETNGNTTAVSSEEHSISSSPLLNETKPKQEQPSTPNGPFLRGRGRGRPKLIGDELDAELVDFMVTVKQANPGGHLSASHALNIARDYILKKAPGLLEEHGGNIKLKLTWAMKLVSRIAERQKEIELGLPAGSLANMVKPMAYNLAPNAFDVMTQNIFAQHFNNAMSQMGGARPSTPEITNVQELSLSKMFSNDDEDDGRMDEEIPDADEGEIAEEAMEDEASPEATEGTEITEAAETAEATRGEAHPEKDKEVVSGLEAALSLPFAFANAAF